MLALPKYKNQAPEQGLFFFFFDSFELIFLKSGQFQAIYLGHVNSCISAPQAGKAPLKCLNPIAVTERK